MRWADDPSEPVSVDEARLYFTDVGQGRPYLANWFLDNTHGHVDLGGSQVHGWLTLPETRDEHLAKTTSEGRTRLIGMARQVATWAGIDLSPFAGVVVVTNRFSDLYGGHGFVETTAERGPGHTGWESKSSPSVLCQELIHALGALEHSRAVGASDYSDPYDVMSLFNAYAGVHPEDPRMAIGPGLNAAFMDRCSWLDTSRTVVTEPGSHVVTLRPLHRRDLAGPLCARLGGWYIEYRPRRGWDVGFPDSVVLVHSRADGTSYLHAALRAGEHHREGSELAPDHRAVHVEAIDDEALIATVALTDVRAQRPVDGPVDDVIGGDDGGGIVIVGGRIVRLPPWSPLVEVLHQIAATEAVADLRLPVRLVAEARRVLLEGMTTVIGAQVDALDDIAVPAPGPIRRRVASGSGERA